jgi:hypothetical protein
LQENKKSQQKGRELQATQQLTHRSACQPRFPFRKEVMQLLMGPRVMHSA